MTVTMMTKSEAYMYMLDNCDRPPSSWNKPRQNRRKDWKASNGYTYNVGSNKRKARLRKARAEKKIIERIHAGTTSKNFARKHKALLEQ